SSPSSLSEIGGRCNTIGIVERGKLLYAGPIDDARRRLGAQEGRVFRVRVVEEGEDGRSGAALMETFRGRPGVAAIKPGLPGEVFVRLSVDASDPSELAAAVLPAGP